jgi:Fanconi-associated nuclease 1
MNWDIVFADVRGAFETQYQSAPLDIVDDSFYLARKEMFDQRLEEIKVGKAAEYIVRHDTKYRARDTWAIGVSWKLELPDLVEIVEVCTIIS